MTETKEMKAVLGERWSSTNRKEYEYILTEDEEKKIIENAIQKERKHHIWKLKDKNCPVGQIEDKLSSINWEERIDKDNLLRRANLFKHIRLMNEESARKKKEMARKERIELEQKCNRDFFFRTMKMNSEKRRGKFITNDDTLPLIETICRFMSNDKDFKGNLKKGLLIRGSCGLGKTYLFDLIKNNPIRPVNIVSMIEVSEEVQSAGFYRPKWQSKLYLDDLGSENHIINHYGTKINWFKDFFEKFYLRSKHYEKLIASTNLSFDELEEKYGYRFRSRVKEVFNIIDVSGKDLRE